MEIKLTPVESKLISAIGYDGESQTLAIQFKQTGGTGSVYHYAAFPPLTFRQFEEAESKGRFFGANIKDKFAYTKQNP